MSESAPKTETPGREPLPPPPFWVRYLAQGVVIYVFVVVVDHVIIGHPLEQSLYLAAAAGMILPLLGKKTRPGEGEGEVDEPEAKDRDRP